MGDLFGWNVRVYMAGRTHYLAQNSRKVAVSRHHVCNTVARFRFGKQDRISGLPSRVELDLIIGSARIRDGRLDDRARGQHTVRSPYAAHRQAYYANYIP